MRHVHHLKRASVILLHPALPRRLFTAIVTPAEIAFSDSPDSISDLEIDGLFVLNRIIDVVFLTDMGVQMNLAYQDSENGGRNIKDLRKIRWRYLKGWFTIDLLSVIPLDIIGLGLPLPDGLRMVRLLRLIRILKMARVLRASRILQRWECEIAIPYANLSMIKFGVAIILCAHWVACAWGMTANMAEESSYT